MSKGSGMGRKRVANKLNKGLDKCDSASHSKQCGREKEVSKGNKKWASTEMKINAFHAEIRMPNLDD